MAATDEQNAAFREIIRKHGQNTPNPRSTSSRMIPNAIRWRLAIAGCALRASWN